MSSIEFRGFVCDEDSQHLASSIVGQPVYTLRKIGITTGRGTPDAAVVKHARDSGCIVVTGNKSDFVREMRFAAQRCTPAECFEGGGMITVPSGLERLAFTNITRKLRLDGETVDWVDVFACNLHVDVLRNGEVVVKRLPLCEFFVKNHAAECDVCQRLGIGIGA